MTTDKGAARLDRSQALLIAGAAVALSYLAAPLAAFPAPLDAAWKAAGIVLIAAFALTRGARLAGAALLASAAGDIALALEPPVVIAGMAFFGLAHALYIAAFVVVIVKGGLQRRYAWVAGLVVAASIAMYIWLAPSMGALLVPGTLYQAIVTAMVASAMLAPVGNFGRAGALTFMASDTLIALGLYKHIAVSPGAIWIAYAGAQFMLAVALSRMRAAAPSNS